MHYAKPDRSMQGIETFYETALCKSNCANLRHRRKPCRSFFKIFFLLVAFLEEGKYHIGNHPIL